MLSVITVHAQKIQPCLNHGVLLEPKGKIINGAGQDLASYKNYRNVMQITMFLDGLQALAIPAYVRIGYEFNGSGWNGYLPASYKTAFQRITNMIRARGLEVATVWDCSADGDANFMDYYPGDAYVNWWGINVFQASHFTDALGK